MNRRNLYKVALGFVGMSVLPDIRALASPGKMTFAKAHDWHWCPYPSTPANSFAGLEAWLKQLPCEQKDGSPSAFCEEIGEPYVTHHFDGRARPGEVAVIEGDVAAVMQRSFSHAIDLKRPRCGEDVVLHWRERPLFEVGPRFVWSESARFVPDGDWLKVTIYARLAVSLKV